MSDKLLAGLMASFIAVPLCLLCVAGPTVLATVGTWITLYVTDIGLPLVAFLLPVAIFVLWRVFHEDEKPRRGRSKGSLHDENLK